jgi:penicillin G amidase
MVWQLSAGWGLEITRTMLAVAVGEERAREWDLEYPKDNPPTLPVDLEKKLVTELLKKQKDGVLKSEQPAPGVNRKGGSNTWAVDSAHSSTGKPLLASDPHLKQTVPSTWYFNHLIVPSLEVNAWGASVPGIPSIAIGHNEHAAWGVTLSFVDVEDLFIEKLNEDESQYEFKGAWRDVKQRKEVIHMKGKSEPHVEIVRETHHGPILTTVVPSMVNHSALAGVAYASTILKSDVPQGMKGMFGLARMKNYKDFRETCSKISDISLSTL